MSETLKITLTAVVGIAVFVLGQLIQKLFIEPIQDQRKAIGEVLYVVGYYSLLNEGVTGEVEKEARKWLTRAAAHLSRSTAIIPAYRLLSNLRIVPKDRIIKAVVNHLTILSHDINYQSLEKCEVAVLQVLNIK